MKRLRLVALVFAAALVVGGGSGSASSRDATRLRVLFVGNSLTATNDLPATVAAIAARGGRFEIEYATVAPGGVSLEDHWSLTGARDVLESKTWDIVVLHQRPTALPESRVNVIE